MIKVRLLTDLQMQSLQGQLFNNSSYFNPVRDQLGNWIISEEEVEFCTIEKFQWINELPVIDLISKTYEE